MLDATAVAELRPMLMRYARLHLRDDALAEDATSETLLALLERPAAFASRSALGTYAVGVLKHKVVDVQRRRAREVPLPEAGGHDDEDGDAGRAIDALFAEDGHWREPPATWRRPDAELEREQLAEALRRCLERLPPRAARVLMMREWLQMDADEVAGEAGLEPSHCSVVLYRARMQMRQCLDARWFGARR